MRYCRWSHSHVLSWIFDELSTEAACHLSQNKGYMCEIKGLPLGTITKILILTNLQTFIDDFACVDKGKLGN